MRFKISPWLGLIFVAWRDLVVGSTAHGPPEAAIAPGRRVQFTRIVMQAVGVGAINDRRRPVAAVRTETAQERTIDAARASEIKRAKADVGKSVGLPTYICVAS